MRSLRVRGILSRSRSSIWRAIRWCFFIRAVPDVPNATRPAAARSASQRLRRREALLEIGDNVLLVLEPDGEAYHVGPGAGLHLLRVGELAVRGRGGMNDERAGIADIGEMREQLHVGDELYAGVVAALEPEGEDRAGALGHVFLREIVVAVAGEARIDHPRHLRLLHQPL